MAVHVTCPQCKRQIPFGRLFCTFCGAKLELSPDNVSRKLTAGEMMGDLKKWVIRLFWFALVASALSLVIWPMPPQGNVGGPDMAAICEQRIRSTQARAGGGYVFIEAFSEEEINAWLKDRVSKLGDASAGAGFTLTEVNLAFRPQLVIVNTRMVLGKIAISYEIEMTVGISPAGLTKSIKSVRIGHIPLPSALHDYFAPRALNVFSGLQEEEALLKKMKQLEINERQVRISPQGR